MVLYVIKLIYLVFILMLNEIVLQFSSKLNFTQTEWNSLTKSMNFVENQIKHSLFRRIVTVNKLISVVYVQRILIEFVNSNQTC